MTEWRIKEMSEMTKTSVRMLRHYDKIGLLKPSYRAANGYRCYTEQDLAKLQQIIALRYFGFSLKTIKTLLQKHHNIHAHLRAQQQVLSKQYLHLQQVNDALSNILNHLSPTDDPNWNDLITLIERYHMSTNLREKLKKTWAGKELSESQFEEYLSIYEQFPNEFAERDKIIEQINNQEFGDPTGPDGERVVTSFYELARKTKETYAKQAKLSSSILASILSGKLSQYQLTPDGMMWITRATLTFWLKRWEKVYSDIKDNLTSDPTGKVGKKIATEWANLVDEYLSVGSRSMLTGILLWEDLVRKQEELKDQKTMPSLQDLVKQVRIKLLTDPEAISWISQALCAHAS